MRSSRFDLSADTKSAPDKAERREPAGESGFTCSRQSHGAPGAAPAKASGRTAAVASAHAVLPQTVRLQPVSPSDTRSAEARRVSILVVDDNPQNVIAVEAALAGLDLNILKAGSGTDALRWLLKEDVALILLDAQMPLMDGYETAEIIRSRDRCRHTPIIFLTAINKTAAHIFRGYSVGAVDYLFKPVEPEILISKVSVFVDQYRSARAIGRQTELLRAANERLDANNRRIVELNQELEARNDELRIERDFIATVLHTAGALVMVLDAQGRIVRFNRACEQATGFSFSEVQYRKPWDLFVPADDRVEKEAAFHAVRRGASTAEAEGRWLTRDGYNRWIAWCQTPLMGEGGEPQYVICTGMDITERRNAERAREKLIREQAARMEAEAAQRRLAFLADASAELLSSLDLTEILSKVAQVSVPMIADWCMAYQTDGRSSPEPVELAHIDKSKRDAALPWMQEHAGLAPSEDVVRTVLNTARAHMLTGLEWLDRDGNASAACSDLGFSCAMLIPVIARSRIFGLLLFARTGSASGFSGQDVSLAEDVAHRAAVALENAQLYREVREASNAKDQFLATVSHELRTPLNSMLGWARLLKSGKLDPAVSARALETIERNARAQAQLIDDILDISRITVGKMRLNVQTFQLVPVIEAAIDVARPTAEMKGVQIASRLDPRCGVINGDPGRIQQIAWNLLANAIKFTPGGGRVTVTLERTDPGLELCVSDTGQGIAPEFLPRVFERFSQAEEVHTRTQGGLGLGLSIVRHLVELHGGTIAAESAGEGSGALFRVLLPLPSITLTPADTETGEDPFHTSSVDLLQGREEGSG